MNPVKRNQPAIMRCFRLRSPLSLTICVNVMFVFHFNILLTFSLLNVAMAKCPKDSLILHDRRRKHPLSQKHMSNLIFSIILLQLFSFICSALLVFLVILIVLSGDVHPNPGPEISRSNSTSSSYLSESINLSKYISFMHYNVQSIKHKLDTLFAEYRDFDILSFSETWLSASTPTSDLSFENFHEPERKDRIGDSHGGVLLYIRNTFRYKRRLDLEIPGVECIWIELITTHKRFLFGVFYRPPNTTAIQHALLEDSIHLAVDTGITDIIITGDFNINMSDATSARKINSLCQQLSLFQCISDPTHFTEHSSSTIDLILTSNKDIIKMSGTGDPCLEQATRYHCPIFCFLNLKSIKHPVFKRNIWLFDKGNYQLLREHVSNINWEHIKDNNINTYTNNVSNKILNISKSCIPNKEITIRPSDPPWITSHVKRLIRTRRRAYRKAQKTNTHVNWARFRNLRNQATTEIRAAKQSHMTKLTQNLTITNSRSWWTCLKSFIKSSSNSSSIPPLQDGDDTIEDEVTKANILNDTFVIKRY